MKRVFIITNDEQDVVAILSDCIYKNINDINDALDREGLGDIWVDIDTQVVHDDIITLLSKLKKYKPYFEDTNGD